MPGHVIGGARFEVTMMQRHRSLVKQSEDVTRVSQL